MDIFATVVQIAGGIATILGLIGFIWKIFRDQKKIQREQEKISEGQKCQLRSDMMRTYYKNRDARKLRQYEAENFVKMYQAYKAMGGNSFIDEIYNHVIQWDVES
jgi:hypothetical protein